MLSQGSVTVVVEVPVVLTKVVVPVEVTVRVAQTWQGTVVVLVAATNTVDEVERVYVDVKTTKPDVPEDSTTVYVVSQGSVTVVVTVPVVLTIVVMPVEVTVRVEQT